MTTYNDVFGNSTVPPSEYGYSSVTLAATTTFVWPYNSDGGDTTSKIMNVTASSAGLAFILPPANEVSTGEDLLIRNVGVETFTVQANDTTPVVTVAAGESKYLYLTDNSTAAGSWGVISFGVGTSSVDAATLVGYGIKAIAATLNQAHEVYVSATDVTIDATFRSKVVVFTGGAGTVTFPASTVVGNDFFFLLRNSGTGTLTLTPDGAETVDALSSMDMQPGESALLFSSGSSWYTVGYGRSVAFNFTQLVKDLSAYSGGTVALTAAEASNKLLTFIGNPAAAVTVEVPAIVSVYYILNSLSTATSVTVEISGGTGVTVPQTQRIIAIADGTNVYSAQSVSASTTVSLLDGSAASPSLNFSSATSTGLFKYSVNGLGVTVNGSRVGFFDTTSCQIDTAFNVVGNLSVATNKFSVTASNGNTTWASGAALTLTGTTVSGGTFSSTTLTSPAINGTVTTTGLTLPAFTLGGTITSNGQSFSGTIANLGTVTTVDINGGTIDGTTQASGTINGPLAVGGTWTAAAAWTLPAVTLSGNVTSSGNPSLNIGTGALTAGSGTFSGNVTVGQGAIASDLRTLIIDGGSDAGKGAGITLRKVGTATGYIGSDSWVTAAGTSNDLAYWARTGYGHKWYVNDSSVAVMTLSSAGALSVAGNVTLGDATTDTVTVNGYVGVGGAGTADTGVTVKNTALTGTIQYGVSSYPTFSSSATVHGIGSLSKVSTAAASFTMTDGAAFYAADAVKGAGSTITNLHGLRIRDQTQGANNYGITSEVTAAANKWNIYASGTAANYFAGTVQTKTTVSVGDATPAASGAGITFPATQSASSDANTLDDYEEGTWTPVLSDGTNNATSAAGVIGYYTKIGRLVHINAYLKTSSLGSVTGSIRINGLPFTSSSASNNISAVTAGYGQALAVTAGQSVGCLVAQNTSYITLYVWNATSGAVAMTATEWSADGDLRFSMTYNAA